MLQKESCYGVVWCALREQLWEFFQAGAHIYHHRRIYLGVHEVCANQHRLKTIEYGTQFKNALPILYHSLKLTQQGIDYRCPKFYNRLPTKIKSCSIIKFSRKVKQYLLLHSFYAAREYLECIFQLSGVSYQLVLIWRTVCYLVKCISCCLPCRLIFVLYSMYLYVYAYCVLLNFFRLMTCHIILYYFLEKQRLTTVY